MKIFISWSDETSHAIALTLGDWIPSVIQSVETYVSPEDIRKGTRWANDVSKELNQTSLGILCVVPGNIGAPWLNFEAGALLKFLDVSNVIPLLIDGERSELDNGPLAQFPAAIFERTDMYQILEKINKNTEKGRLSKERLRNTFEVWWPKLELDVESIRKKESTEIQDPDQPEKAPETDKPKKEPDKDKPEKTPDIDEPKKTPDTGKPIKVSGTDQPEKKPERTSEAAIKSETKETQDTDKPVKYVSAKPALEEIEIEVLKVLYKPPGYAPTTAAAVGYKLDISAQKAREHLDTLERKNYVREHLYVGRAKEYSIARKGKEYLTKHDLLNKRQDG
jgi:DNA-binding MarR family transcriptional regulator